MSQIDQSLDAAVRNQLLSEVRWFLPAFLSAASHERSDPVQGAAGLLRIKPSDLQRVLTVHALLAEPVRTFIAALPDGARRPLMSSVRPRVAGREVTSGIDWAATARHRATSNSLEPTWVVRPARRIFDIPENRALVWLLKEVQRRVSAVRQPTGSPSAWQREIRETGAVVERHLRLAWLEGVLSEWPGDAVYSRLQADRLGFYRMRVDPAARFLRSLLYSPSTQEVVDAICDRYFEPSQDWKLFEIAVLLRISNALARVGERVGALSLPGSGQGPFASYRLASGRMVRVWYQRWPPSSGFSELQDAVTHYQIDDGGPSRPDVTIEIVDRDAPTRLVVLELKASSSSSYVGSGFNQLLSYLRERPALTVASPSGWLVSPYPHGQSIDPEGRALWFVPADQVASAVVATVLTGSPVVPPAWEASETTA